MLISFQDRGDRQTRRQRPVQPQSVGGRLACNHLHRTFELLDGTQFVRCFSIEIFGRHIARTTGKMMGNVLTKSRSDLILSKLFLIVNPSLEFWLSVAHGLHGTVVDLAVVPKLRS